MTINYSYYDPFSIFGNISAALKDASDQLDLKAPEDTTVDTVLTSVVLNSIVCVLLMGAYETLRRVLPAVYSNQKRMDRMARRQQTQTQGGGGGAGGSKGAAHSTAASSKAEDANDDDASSSQRSDIGAADILRASPSPSEDEFIDVDDNKRRMQHKGYVLDNVNDNDHDGQDARDDDPEVRKRRVHNANGVRPDLAGHNNNSVYLAPLPDEARPLDWIKTVYGVSWAQVRHKAGLDGYFFLRYIRMNVRITAVSTFWFFLVLVPIYASGNNNVATGWYHFSIQNLKSNDFSIWVPCVFLYLFSAFCCFCMKQEYRHYLELRQDFLARGSSHVHPQHHYSLMIENIPAELRSDSALKEYFDKLFPGRVHSATVVLNLPDLEEASQRCLRTCRRLEKSLAYWHATSKRPSHVVGRGRISCLGVDLQPWDCSSIACHGAASNRPGGGGGDEPLMVEDDGRYAERPERGTRVDSISYYTQELAADSRALFKLQQRKLRIAESGNASITADNWLEQASRNFSRLANEILDESSLENDLLTPQDSYDDNNYYSTAARYQYSTSSPYALYNSDAHLAAPNNSSNAVAGTGPPPSDGYGSFGTVLRRGRNPNNDSAAGVRTSDEVRLQLREFWVSSLFIFSQSCLNFHIIGGTSSGRDLGGRRIHGAVLRGLLQELLPPRSGTARAGLLRRRDQGH
jgi:Late exocytosis, associated with Golgi transport/Cytosolic domain of 10TM putative phosphate transporter